MSSFYTSTPYHVSSSSSSPTSDNFSGSAMNSTFRSPYDSPQRLPSSDSGFLQPNPSSSLDSSGTTSLLEQVKNWNDAQVKQWMTENRVGNYADLFAKNDIRGSVLLDMDGESLKELGLRLVGDRTKIMIAIKKLRAQCMANSSTSSLGTHTLRSQASIPAMQLYTSQKLSRERSESSASSASAHHHTPSRPVTSSSSRSTGHRRPGSKGVPPPLHLTQTSSGNLGQAYQTPHTLQGHNDVRPSPRNPTSTGPPVPSKTPNLLSSSTQNTPYQRTGALPQIPSSGGWHGDYGLPKAPAPGNLLSANVSRTKSITKSPANVPQNLSDVSNYHKRSPSTTPAALPMVPQRTSSGQSQGYSGSPDDNLYRGKSDGYQNSGGLSLKASFGRPTTPGGHGPTPSLDDLMKNTVKFKGEDGVSKMMQFSDNETASQIMLAVLRKFGKMSKDYAPHDLYNDDDDDIAEMDGWVVYGSVSDSPMRVLTNGELLGMCQNGTRTDRQKGLVLKRRTIADLASKKNRRVPGANQLAPTYSNIQPPATQVEPASPSSVYADSLLNAYGDDVDSTFVPRMPNRASTISVMSGLGAFQTASASQPSRSPSIAHVSPLRFAGQRPPSELITGHFTDYFPAADQKKLSKNVRKSVRKSMLHRGSHYGLPDPRASWGHFAQKILPSRFSASTIGSSHRVSTIDDGSTISSLDSRTTEYPPSSAGAPRTAPLNVNAKDRLSVFSQIYNLPRPSLDSDNASILTMDEVTAEVENRRQSIASWMQEEDEDSAPPIATHVIDEEEEEEEDETEGEPEEDEDDKPQAYTSQGAKAQVSWIKGALIGAGSFGSVYLGMNSKNGTLMAVKQVELPTGNSHNEERKKSMLDALEREIALLKELQHERIVQYLDSSSDGVHLNIFLEYVPGGSVSLLLKTYGAFEEDLVRTWGHQILEGLEYLHDKDIIHRDIKGANVLVDNKGGIKISDFGISKKVEDGTMNLLANPKARSSLQGSVFWMAPEVVKQTSYTKKADIWSLGCLIIEMLTGSHPWAKLTQMQAIFQIGTSARPSIPGDISEHGQDFLEQTFKINYLERPTATELLRHPWQTLSTA